MADKHTSVEKRLKRDITVKNEIRKDLEKRMSLIRRLSRKLRKCKNRRNITRSSSTIKRHCYKTAQLRVELLQRNEDLEKRIKKEMKYSEKEINDFKTQLDKEKREMEEARSKLKKVKTKSEKTDEQEGFSAEIFQATKRLIRETSDVKNIEKELSSEEKDEILFTLELKRIESDKLVFGQ